MSGSSEKQPQNCNHHLGSVGGVKPILRVVDMSVVPQHAGTATTTTTTSSSYTSNSNNNSKISSSTVSAQTVPPPPPVLTAATSSSGTVAACNSSSIIRRASMKVTALRPDFSKVSSSPPSAITNTAASTVAAVSAAATQLVSGGPNATPTTTKPTISMKDIIPGNQPDKESILINHHHRHNPVAKAPPPTAKMSNSGKEAIAALLSSCTTKRKPLTTTTTGTIATTTTTRTTSFEGIPTKRKSNNNNKTTTTTTTGKRRRPSFSPFLTEHKNPLDEKNSDSPPQQRKRTSFSRVMVGRKSSSSTSSQIRRHNSINFDNLMGYRSGSDSSSLQSGGGLSSGNNSFGNLQNSTFATFGGGSGSANSTPTNYGVGGHNLLHKHLTHRRMNSNNSNGQGSGEVPKLSAFPFSAPRFTPEDEQKEIESMTDGEKQQAIDDMRGITTRNHKIVETPQMIHQKKEELQRALQLLAPTEKSVYEEALEKCPPEVFERECEPLRFLRAEQFDASQAAKRICAYWQYRKKIFGPLKAFETMTLSGCMSEDLEAIIARWDFTHLCPPDEKGRTVFYMDRSRRGYASEGISNVGLLRLLWYVSHVAIEREETQKNGVVLIIMFKLPSHAHFDRKTAKANFGSFRDALPVRVQAVHMLHMPEYMRHLFPVIKNLMGKHMRARMKIHNGSEYSVLSTLSGEFAFSPKNLPISMGGEYHHDTLGFIAERERIEGCSVLAVSPVPAGQVAVTGTIEAAAADKEDPSETTTEKVANCEETTTKSETPQVVVVVKDKRVQDEGGNHEMP